MAEANSFQFIRPNQGRRIDARPRNVEYEEGTGPRTGLIARRVDPGMGGGLDAHFLAQRYKDLPMSMINREANIRRGQGMMYNPYTGTYQRDSMYNRSGFGFGREPVGGMQPQAPAMTEPQMDWARRAQEKQSGAGALGKIGEKMAKVNPPTSGMMGSLGWLPKIAQAGLSTFSSNPYTPQKSPQQILKDDQEGRAMMSDFNRGVQTTTRGNTTSFSSPYGRGRITQNMAPGKPQSMVKDEFGRWVPMSPYLADKKAVQASKGMI